MLEFALRVRNSMQPSMGRTARRLSKTMPSAWHFCLSCISGTRVCGRWSRARLSGAVQKNLNTSIGAGFGGILAEKARGCWGYGFLSAAGGARILFGFAEKAPTSVAASPSDSDSSKRRLPKPCLHPLALHGARIREAQNMPQGMF